jgi:hypothetical protein
MATTHFCKGGLELAMPIKVSLRNGVAHCIVTGDQSEKHEISKALREIPRSHIHWNSGWRFVVKNPDEWEHVKYFGKALDEARQLRFPL